MNVANQQLRLTKRAAQRAFTLIELLIASGVFVLLGAILFAFFEMGLRTCAKTLSVVLTEWQTRKALATIMREIQLASGAPTFLDHNGNDLLYADGAGLGLKYQKWSDEDYNEREIAALIVVNGNELRYYPSDFDVTRLSGPYRVISRSVVAPQTFVSATNGGIPQQYPFHFTSYPATTQGSASRMIDVNLRVLARDYHQYLYSRRQGGIGEPQGPNTFLQIRSLIGYRFLDTGFN